MLSIQSWGKEEKGVVQGDGFVFLSHHYVWWSSAFLVMAEFTGLPMGSSKLIFWVVLLVQMAFALPLKLSSFQPRGLLSFTIPVLCPIP